MNPAIRQTFAISAARSPVNELLTAIMRSFGEQPAEPRDNRTTDNGTMRPKARKRSKPLRANS